MQALLFANLSTGAASSDLEGKSVSFPTLVQGDDLTLSFRFAQTIAGNTFETSRTIVGARASLGRLDARPLSGSYRLKVGSASPVVGGNVTEPIPFNAPASRIVAALNALSGGFAGGQKPVTATLDNGSALLRAANGSLLSLAAYENELAPISFVRVRTFDFDGGSIAEIRLVQAPVAFTDSSSLALPPAPSVTRVRAGGTSSEVTWNEIQALYVPPNFRGSYQLRRGYRKSPLLSITDDATVIATAIKSLAEPDGSFSVTNPLAQVANIEFKGSMAGATFGLIAVDVFNAPPGDLTLTLPLDRAELASVLRAASPVDLVLEVEATVADEADSDIHHVITVLQVPVKVAAEMNAPELGTEPEINWTHPPTPRDYVAFTPDQVNSGVLHYATTLGNGTARTFEITHGLASPLVHVVIAQNIADGNVLQAAEDYALVIRDANVITIALAAGTATPASGALKIAILAMGAASQFNSHTHTIAQIVGLQDILDELGGRLTTVEDRVGISALGTPPGEPNPVRPGWTLLPYSELFGKRGTSRKITEKRLAEIDLDKLPKFGGGLLAAVHSASSTSLPLPLAVGTPGVLYVNASGSAVALPGSRGHRSDSLAAGAFAAYDLAGAFWYEVARYGTEKTYYPVDMDRELFFLTVSAAELLPGTMFELFFGLDLGLFKTPTRAQIAVVIEWGTFTEDTSPATTGANLAAISWNATPLLIQRVMLASTPVSRSFGCRIKRTSGNALSAQKIIFGAVAGGDSCPDAPSFALRARLVRFDTEDAAGDSRGFLGVIGLDVADGATESLGKASIKSIA